MKIVYKLTLGYLAVALLIALVGHLAGSAARRALKDSIGEASRRLARQIIDELDRHIQSRIEQFQAYSKSRSLQEAAARSNEEFEKLHDIQAFIQHKDEEWTSVPKETVTPFMNELISSALSEEFRHLLEFYRQEYGYTVLGELFVTNKYGANIAQSGKTTDYRQDDESWWDGARKDGVFVEDVEYDESADVYSTDIGIRVEDEAGNFVGVVKVVLDVKEVINIINEARTRYLAEARRAEVYTLLDAQKRVLYSTRDFSLFQDGASLLPEGYGSAPRVPRTGTFIRYDEERGGLLCAYARSNGHRDFKGLGWILLLEHDMERTFAPAAALGKRISIGSLLVAVLGVVIGAWVSTSLSKRIGRLRRGTEIIGAGNLDHKVGTNASDEIGELSRAFDAMTERLKATTVSRDELAKEVDERKQAQAELARSNADLEQFAYVASHDLQEPLRMVTSYLGLLRRRSKGKLDADADDFFNFASDGATRMQTMLNDLLAYSRVGTYGRDFAPTQSEKAFEYAVNNLQTAIEESGAVVTHDPLPTVTADATQLVQLFQNLIGNAIKFRGEPPPRVHVSAQQREKEWVFSVRDNGVCKRIVERHGGRIWATSQPDEGSTFHFSIPMTRTRSHG